MQASRSSWQYEGICKNGKFDHLKKVIAIFLFLQIGSNNAFAEELVRLPRLYTHFLHHTREHRDTKSFADFLHKHYSHHQHDRSATKHDGDNDCDLPFKHCGSGCLTVHSGSIAFTTSQLRGTFIFAESGSFVRIPPDERYESTSLCSIWQPPKSN